MKGFLPHIIALITFFVVFGTFFSLSTFDNKTLPQNDVLQSNASAKETHDFRKEEGSEPLWSGRIFSGMPTYMLATSFPSNWFEQIKNKVRSIFPQPMDTLFIQFICFYILLCTLKVRPYLAIVGAIGFCFSTFNILSIEAGHIWKVITMGITPLLLAGLIMLARKEFLKGAITYILAVAFLMSSKHYQIIYYFGLFLIPFFVYQAIRLVKEKDYKTLAITIGILIFGGALGVGPSASELWTSLEYNKFTMRGGSELSPVTKAGEEKAEKSTGLDKDYAFAWSQGKWETMTLFVPRLYGGASGEALDVDSDLGQELKKLGASKKNREGFVKQAPTYWGDQPFTGGPMYAGIVFMLFAIISLFIVDYRRWLWIVLGGALLTFIAWGSNMEWFNYTLFDNFPMFNKFRTVSMALYIPMTAILILAGMGLEEIIQNKDSKELRQKLMAGFYVTSGLVVFTLIVGLFLSFESENDISSLTRRGIPEKLLPDFQDALIADRQGIFHMDVFRSLIFIGIGFTLVFFYLKGKMQSLALILTIGALCTLDLWTINKRYLNEETFVKAKKEKLPPPSIADNEILKDKDLSYRVLNLNNPFNEAITAVYHKSIGGYHGLKMGRYQDLIDRHIGPEMQQFIAVLNNKPTQQSIDQVLGRMQVLNMLNMKYLIYNPAAAPIKNTANFGNAWFVENVNLVNNPDEEIEAIRAGKTNLKQSAVIDESKFKIEKTDFNVSPTSSIKMTAYAPNKLVFESSNENEGLAVFSEIYYPKGWTATLDNQPIDILRANYMLRAISIPAGEHKIEFSFKPTSYYTGETIAKVSSILIILLSLGGFAFIGYKEYKTPPKKGDE